MERWGSGLSAASAWCPLLTMRVNAGRSDLLETITLLLAPVAHPRRGDGRLPRFTGQTSGCSCLISLLTQRRHSGALVEAKAVRSPEWPDEASIASLDAALPCTHHSLLAPRHAYLSTDLAKPTDRLTPREIKRRKRQSDRRERTGPRAIERNSHPAGRITFQWAGQLGVIIVPTPNGAVVLRSILASQPRYASLIPSRRPPDKIPVVSKAHLIRRTP